MNQDLKSDFANFLDRVASHFPDVGKKSDNRRVEELAKFIGATRVQVYEWVIARKYKPNGAITLKMQEWLKMKESVL